MRTPIEAELALERQDIEDLHGFHMDAPAFLPSGSAKSGLQPAGLCKRPR